MSGDIFAFHNFGGEGDIGKYWIRFHNIMCYIFVFSLPVSHLSNQSSF